MSKKYIFVLVILSFTVHAVFGQDNPSAHLRVMQLSYLPPSNVTIDISLDNTILFEGISFPFATDYVDVVAGEHTLTTSIVGQTDATASTTLVLETGRSYSVVVDGDYSQQVTFIVVDETDLLADATGSTAVVVNLTSQPITDITLVDEVVWDAIPVHGFGYFGLPETEFMISGSFGGFTHAETFTPHANTNFLIAVREMPNGEPQIIYQRSSQLTIAEYLQSINDGAQFSLVADLIGQTDLLDALSNDGTYTLFLPVDGVIEGLLSMGLSSDAEQLAVLLSAHITEQSIPPYLLPTHETLMTLGGDSVLLNFSGTESGYWEIEGAPILWDVRLANGVIYGIEGVIDLGQ